MSQPDGSRSGGARVVHVSTADLAIKFLLRNQLREFSAAGYDVHAASARGAHAAELSCESFSYTCVPIARRINPAADMRSYRSLARYFRHLGADIVHTHTNKAGILGCWAADAAGVPCVVSTVHGFYFHEHMRASVRGLYVRLYRETFRRTKRVFMQSREDVDTAIREHIVDAENIVHIGNGVDLERFNPWRAGVREAAAARRREIGIPSDALVVGIVARINNEKGLGELIDATAAVRETASRDVHLVVVGDGPARGSFEKRARTLGIESAVHFAGYRDDVENWLLSFDVYALPSYREGFPRTLCEAFALGIPCVATRIRGCRELIDDGETGILVERHDVSDLAGALRTLLGRADMRRRIGDAARGRAIAALDEQRVIDRIIQEYETLGYPPPATRTPSSHSNIPRSRALVPTP